MAISVVSASDTGGYRRLSAVVPQIPPRRVCAGPPVVRGDAGTIPGLLP